MRETFITHFHLPEVKTEQKGISGHSCQAEVSSDPAHSPPRLPDSIS